MEIREIAEVAGLYMRRAVFASFAVFAFGVAIAWSAVVLAGPLAGAVAFLLLGSMALAVFKHGFDMGQWMVSESVCVLLDANDKANQQSSVAVSGRGNVVSVQNSPVAVQSREVVRLVPVHSSNRLVEGVDENDLRHFVEQIFIRGFSQRAWLGQRLPSGRLVESFSDYDSLIKPLVVGGLIVDRGERKAGKLVVASPDEARQALGL